jgi:hypothetical protein
MIKDKKSSLSDRTALLEKKTRSDGRFDYGQMVREEDDRVKQNKVTGRYANLSNEGSVNTFSFIPDNRLTLKEKVKNMVGSCLIL